MISQSLMSPDRPVFDLYIFRSPDDTAWHSVGFCLYAHSITLAFDVFEPFKGGNS
jgi:hypothetical protein